MNHSFKGGEVTFILHKSIKLCGHDNHWNICPHRRKRHDAVGQQVFLKGSEISGSADKIRDHAENQEEYGHHPEHSRNKQQNRRDYTENGESSLLRYFCHIEHENCPRKERHDHWHKREGDRRHLRNTANHKRHHSIDERKDTNRYKVPCFQLLRICFKHNKRPPILYCSVRVR